MKYFSKKCKYQGMTFDSRQEMERYIELRCMEIRGEVGQIHRQVRFMIIKPTYGWRQVRLKTKVKEVLYVREKAAYYTADFVYREGSRIIIEDVKSAYTAKLPDYVLRRKIMVKCLDERNAARVDPSHAYFVFREAEVTKGKTKTRDI